MPVTPTYPGVYIQELPSSVRTIVGVPTSVTAFVGRALRGPTNDPKLIHGFDDFERLFGGLWGPSRMSYAVQQFYQNGGSDALIVRVAHPDAGAATILADTLTLVAESVGAWGNQLEVDVDLDVRDTSDPHLFNLVVRELDPTHPGIPRRIETLRNLSTDLNSRRPVTKALEEESRLVRISGTPPTLAPATGTYTSLADGADGGAIDDTDVLGTSTIPKAGIYALDQADIFNLLCLPPLDRGLDIGNTTLASALTYCVTKRAILIVDAPSAWRDKDAAQTGMRPFALSGDDAKNAAVYFPRLKIPDALQENLPDEFAPCGVVAGVIARTDLQRGVWKAPAGIEASLAGNVQELVVRLTDKEHGDLNPLGLNCFRTFNVIGKVIWGARTLRGADVFADQWKYLPVRRLALYIEESLFRGTQWVVFEPNDEPLWAQIRLNVGAFMQDLFRQGAFQGSKPNEAYFVRCDHLTTTQFDIDRGIVNIIVGFAPLKPAEFVIISIQQIAGQSPV